MTRLVLISDTHLEEPELPEGDILIHCGDFTYSGLRARKNEVAQVVAWLESQASKFKYMVGTNGNHDWGFDTFDNNNLGPLKLLFDEYIEIEGLKIYGTPYVPQFYNWAFMESEAKLAERYSKIPEGLDILITHGPPAGILDRNIHNNSCGSKALRDAIFELRDPPKVCVWGHIHPHGDQPKHLKSRKTDYFNASYVDEYYNAVHEPIIFDI